MTGSMFPATARLCVSAPLSLWASLPGSPLLPRSHGHLPFSHRTGMAQPPLLLEVCSAETSLWSLHSSRILLPMVQGAPQALPPCSVPCPGSLSSSKPRVTRTFPVKKNLGL